MKTVTIKQDCMLKATPRRVYDAWMTSSRHAEFTGQEASINSKVGGKFSTFDGWASGANIELVPDKKIVQTWRADDWPAGAESTITVLLQPAAGGTKLLFKQTGVPAAKAKAIAQGWREYYWPPLQAYLSKK